ncbi:hypothetical protein, partial [Paenibacillus validus]|uniref:hypothetical protein n=1 Tax=Paenibacillus validus TaxID=44253 RepID=UPI001E643A33
SRKSFLVQNFSIMSSYLHRVFYDKSMPIFPRFKRLHDLFYRPFPVPKNESSRINYLVNCLTPILKKVYITNIFFELFIDIKRIIPDLKLDDIEGDSDIEKFIALVCLDDYSNERKARLYDMFSTNNPLATNRIYEMKKNYSDARNILKLIENHEQKVQWQLKRIYRCRNEIVHS